MGFSPLLLFRTWYDQGIVDLFLVGETSNLFGSHGAMGGQSFDGAGKDINFDAHVVDFISRNVL